MSITQSLELSLRDDVALVESDAGLTVLRGTHGDTPLQGPASWSDALGALAGGGVTEQQLAALVLCRGDAAALFQFQHLLGRLGQAGLLCHTLNHAGRTIATLVPIGSAFRLSRNFTANEPQQVSRFAYCHVEHGRMVLECPLGHAKLLLHDAVAVRLLAALAQPRSCEELAASADVEPALAAAFLNLLASMHALTAAGADGRTAEDAQAALAQWEFHDLLFHSRTRLGRHRNPYGGSYRWQEQFPPLPPTKPPISERGLALHTPDLEHLMQHDRPFTAVLEARASVRDYDTQPISGRELGEFLYRCARVKRVYHAEGEMSLSFRPYPAGGALYELEIYALVDNCSDIPGGLYHYDPLAHQLHRLPAQANLVEALLNQAWATANRQSRPQISLHITARFQRVQWKYQSIAYSLVLKHVGVLFQTMYLVATAMDLAPCALGGGNSDLFANAASLEYYAESSVGEFVLGSRKRDAHD